SALTTERSNCRLGPVPPGRRNRRSPPARRYSPEPTLLSRPALLSRAGAPALQVAARDLTQCSLLGDPDVVTERVAQRAVDAIRLLGRLLAELDALGAELRIG